MAQRCSIVVLDTDPGISREMQDWIFEPFVQTVGDTKPVQGTGLDLPISRSLVQAMAATCGREQGWRRIRVLLHHALQPFNKQPIKEYL